MPAPYRSQGGVAVSLGTGGGWCRGWVGVHDASLATCTWLGMIGESDW
jgi:hypothetical protein